jgi:hypothetical protein
MEGTDYNLATSILFVGYLLMQLPSNLLLTRIRPSLLLGIAMAIWYACSRERSRLLVLIGLKGGSSLRARRPYSHSRDSSLHVSFSALWKHHSFRVQ